MKVLPEGWQDVGAIAGIVALVWNGVAAVRNRHRFKVECRIAIDESREVVSEPSTDGGLGQIGFVPVRRGVVNLRVVNVGSKPGFLAAVNCSPPPAKGDRFVCAPFPVKLEPGQAWSWSIGLDRIGANSVALWAEDPEGRKFRVSWWRFRKLKAEATEVAKSLT